MSKSLQPVEYEKYWELPIGGEKVVGLTIGYGFALEISHPDYSLTIRLIQDFLLSQGGQENVLSIENPPSLAPGLGLLQKPIASIKIAKAGSLEIFFSDQDKISVQPSEAYEAWHIVGGYGAYGDLGLTGLRIICIPGGKLAIWTPDSDDLKDIWGRL